MSRNSTCAIAVRRLQAEVRVLEEAEQREIDGDRNDQRHSLRRRGLVPAQKAEAGE